jgi:hypothetical protein
MGYMTVGPEKYAKKILEIMELYTELKKKDLAFLSSFDLKSAYERAKSWGNELLKEKALNAGLKKEDNLYFLFEKYLSLLKSGNKKEADDIKKQIIEADPNNIQNSCFRLALIDFEVLIKTKSIHEPEEIIKPLVEYINEYGKKDKDNLWRLEMVISQFLGSKGLFKDALRHARASCKAAPSIIRKEIVQTILYLKLKIQEEDSLANFEKARLPTSK